MTFLTRKSRRTLGAQQRSIFAVEDAKNGKFGIDIKGVSFAPEGDSEIWVTVGKRRMPESSMDVDETSNPAMSLERTSRRIYDPT